MPKFNTDEGAVKYVVRSLIDAGIEPVSIQYDGEIESLDLRGLRGSTLWTEFFQTDAEYVRFEDQDGNRCSLYFVYGNDPFEVVADYSPYDDSDLSGTIARIVGALED